MSLQNSGRTIQCDGADCPATTRSVVAMRPTAEQQRDNHDWLFACIEGLWRHYCPRCAPDFLQQHLVTGIARS